uniref:BTB/POZ domain-containing protein n=1 Tax=Borely moumouvirus TaxID=2712067 RepID=A0A6G6AAC0_9VIRU
MDDSKFDLCLTLFDNNDKITLNVVRQTLCEKCPYFQKLLSGNFIESGQNKVEIFVPNVFIVEEIIKSFTETEGEVSSDWEYYFEKCFCLDFLMLSCSKYLDKIINLMIPENQYGTLGKVFDIILSDLLNSGDKLKIISLNYLIIKYLVKNLPKDFDTNLFSTNIKQNIDNFLFNNFLTVADNNIYIENYITNHNMFITKFAEGKYFFLPDTNNLILVNNTITFIDILTGKITFTVSDEWNYEPIKTHVYKEYIINMSSDYKYLVCGDNNIIKLFNIEEKKIEKIWNMYVNKDNDEDDNEEDHSEEEYNDDDYFIDKILFTSDNKNIIIKGFIDEIGNGVQKYDLLGNLIWSNSNFGDYWNYIDIICQEDKIIFLGVEPLYTWFDIIDINTGKILFTEHKYDEVDYICDVGKNCIAFNNENKIYIYDLEIKKEVKFLGEHNNMKNLFYNNKNNHLISYCGKYIKIWNIDVGLLDQIPMTKEIMMPLFNYKIN